MHLKAIKKQGRRSDLITELESLIYDNNTNIIDTLSPIEIKLNSYNSYDKMKMEYGLSKDSIARYMRISKLAECLLKRLDNVEF